MFQPDIAEADVRRLLGSALSKRAVCPACGPGRRREHQRIPTLKIDLVRDKIAYYCHHCQARGQFSETPERAALQIQTKPPVSIREVKPMEFPALDSIPAMEEQHIEFLASRGIDYANIPDAYLYPGTYFFPSAGRRLEAIVYPYIKDGRIYAAKVRAISGKHFICLGSCDTFYLDWSLAADVDGSTLVVVEGELDALSLRSVGVRNAISVPNGASTFGRNGEQAGLRGVDEAGCFANIRQFLGGARRIILAGDGDRPGLELRRELARRFGLAKCWIVEWPAGAKDANAALIAHGPEKLRDLVVDAAPMPVAGLFEARSYIGRLVDLYEGKLARGLDTGLIALDHLYSIPFGTLTVVTGWPNDGKSQLVDNLLVHLAQKHGLKIACWSPENTPEIHIAKLIEIKSGQPFFPGHGQKLSAEDIPGQLEWVQSRFYFLVDGDEVEASLESILERAEAAVQRYGIRVLLIDPYNHISKPAAGNDQEVEWIRKLLIRIKRFAQSHELHIFLVAHPRQLPAGSKRFPPTGLHISGGAPWNAITDFGLTVYRPFVPEDEEEGERRDADRAQVLIWKARHRWQGKRGVAELQFDSTCGRYYSKPQFARAPARGPLIDDDI